MHDFISIDFETANPKRVSACAIGYARVVKGKLIESNGYLIKPIGGHAPFQSKIHGIKEEDTVDKPDFGKLYHQIKNIFDYPLVMHSLFDKQVLQALSEYFDLELSFQCLDACAIAKQKLPDLSDHKLKTLAKYFGLPKFKHHDAEEDAITCANIFLRLSEASTDIVQSTYGNDVYELKGMIIGILADNEVNYKEAYELLYWLEDHNGLSSEFHELYVTTKSALEDDHLDKAEASEIRTRLRVVLSKLGRQGI